MLLGGLIIWDNLVKIELQIMFIGFIKNEERPFSQK
jgi:hypothetical protein